MRTAAAQLRQVRKEATASARPLRRDLPGGGILFFLKKGYS